MERRNRGLSLLNQTAAHCISPSSCDNTTSLNDINLQLHASSTVSNPYTFSISSNTSFGASVEPELPKEVTELLDLDNTGINFDGTVTGSFTVPAGCKVVRADVFDRPGREVTLSNKDTRKLWVSTDDDKISNMQYIGVTSGKTYNLEFDTYASEFSSANVLYSAEINTHTPDVEDY